MRLLPHPTPLKLPVPPSLAIKMPEPAEKPWNDPSKEEMNVFLPPVNRAMRTLDRAFFKKAIPLAAAHVFDPKNITKFQKECAKDVLRLPRTKTLIVEKDEAGKERKLLLLRPGIKIDDLSTAGEKTRGYVESKILELLPYTLHMAYENWSYYEIMSAILPEELMDEVPQSFAQAGHLAHLNLRSQYAPYKHIIASVIIDKNPRITTVINKIEDVGAESEFRTFPMEVLAGVQNTEVEVNESDCTFKFDFAKVYWNTRLGDEHRRVFSKFSPGEAVADVMAGVGPFAVPAGKRRVHVWANDLNPESYKSLKENIKRNKVDNFVTPSCLDGRAFIRSSIHSLLALSSNPETNTITIQPPPPRSRSSSKPIPPQEPTIVPIPATFSHFVMNLPATATKFLDAFRGAYKGLEHVFGNDKQLPMIHVYTFHKSPYPENAPRDICEDISQSLGHKMIPEMLDNLEHVRIVSPNKVYYCVSFRLPREVAFAEVPEEAKAEGVPRVELGMEAGREGAKE